MSKPWEIIVAENGQDGRHLRDLLLRHHGIDIPDREVYLIHRPEKFQGARFTKVYLSPRLTRIGSIRELFERAEALTQLQRTCLRGGEAFEGFHQITAMGTISGKQAAL